MNKPTYRCEFPPLTTRRTLVYISGPMTTGSAFKNIHKGCIAGATLLDRGYAVDVPHPYALMEMITPRDGDTWLQNDFERIRRADCLYRMPEPSVGGDLEVEWARRLGKPVYFDIDSLCAIEPIHRLCLGFGSPVVPALELVSL